MDNLAIEQLNQHLAFLMLKVIFETDKNKNLANAQQWEHEVLIDDIDYGVMKLVPLYLRKVKEIGFQSNHEKRLKVLHKYWWLKTLKNLDRLAEALEVLIRNRREVMLIKGVPMLTYYEENVLRPMADLDILVYKNDVLDSIEILEKIGWRSTDPSFLIKLRKSTDLCLDFKHSIELEHSEEKTKMDLHWKVGNYASWELTNHVWKNAQSSLQFPLAKTPSTSDLLCMAILHSVDSESRHHFNWIVDIDKMQIDLTDEIWRSAQSLATFEKKENWFDYGCYLLHKIGVKTPIAYSETTAPLGRLKKAEFGSKLNFLNYFLKKINNNLTILSINFPHDRGLNKIYRMMRRISYFKLNRGI